jgi:valyl-tRNA synthetase
LNRCISRQLWWGHRIPAYLAIDKSVGRIDDEAHWIVARTVEEAQKIAQERFPNVAADQLDIEQDPDVLDTWFSSGLFPFATMGWPNNTSDFQKYYPGTLLETGHDILFFWVARMVMMGLELTDTLPFHTIYLHAMVRDKFGEKMSKSKGNIIDPLDVIEGATLETLSDRLIKGNLDPNELKKGLEATKREYPEGIAQCGADALRFGLLAFSAQGRDVNLDVMRVVAYRQFGNKLWQATKFALMNFDEQFQPPKSLDSVESLVNQSNNFCDRWILSRLHAAVARADGGFQTYEFAEATTAFYSFWLYEFCDVYLVGLFSFIFFFSPVPILFIAR